MKVNIVAPAYKGDWVIARLARHLIERNGWTGDRKPASRADVNIFIPYCQWRFTKWRDTLTAAWFTHREEESVEGGAKLKRWRMIVPEIDLRVTPARFYLAELNEHGRAIQIQQPVEKCFGPAPRACNRKPTIGVAGRVYLGGRKGEEMVARLAKDTRLTVRAAGIGWPVPTTHYQWRDVPRFYHGLDVFVCTSVTEGGPITVYEALACGRPVVVPCGVGQMDELSEMPGIRHYQRGDYADMVRALWQAIDELADLDPIQLANQVRHATPKAWARDWLEALESGLP